MSDLDQPIYRVHTLGSQSPSKRISAVVFDMDGTIIHEAIDYVAMRAALAMPYPIDVIVEIRAMTDETKQKEYAISVRSYEPALICYRDRPIQSVSRSDRSPVSCF